MKVDKSGSPLEKLNQSEIDAILNKIDSLNNEILRLQKHKINESSEVRKLQDHYDFLQKEIDKFTKERNSLADKVSDLKQEEIKLNETLRKISEDANNTQTKLSIQEQALDDLKNSLEKRERALIEKEQELDSSIITTKSQQDTLLKIKDQIIQITSNL